MTWRQALLMLYRPGARLIPSSDGAGGAQGAGGGCSCSGSAAQKDAEDSGGLTGGGVGAAKGAEEGVAGGRFSDDEEGQRDTVSGERAEEPYKGSEAGRRGQQTGD